MRFGVCHHKPNDTRTDMASRLAAAIETRGRPSEGVIAR